MDMNKLTQKSQEALAEAQSQAISLGHQEVSGAHLLLVLLKQDGLVPRLFQKMDVPVDALTSADRRKNISVCSAGNLSVRCKDRLGDGHLGDRSACRG